jgi:hypothetical protein
MITFIIKDVKGLIARRSKNIPSIVEICTGRCRLVREPIFQEVQRMTLERTSAAVDVFSAIRERRSIRRYTGEPITDEQLNAILQAGLCAPTANNKRPYHFVVIQDRARLERLAEGKPYARMLASAACGLAICGDQASGRTHGASLCGLLCRDAEHPFRHPRPGPGRRLAGCDQGFRMVQAAAERFWSCRTTSSQPRLYPWGIPQKKRPTPHTWEESKIHWDKWTSGVSANIR